MAGRLFFGDIGERRLGKRFFWAYPLALKPHAAVLLF
jgi:hypothetical protein